MHVLKEKRKIAFSTCLMILLLAIAPVHTLAASDSDGWFDTGSRDSTIYGSSSHDSLEASEDSDDDPNIIDKYIGGLFYDVANIILNTFLVTDDMDLSIDGVVLGRMSPNTDVSYTRFELTKGNPYGIIGAWIFVSIRTVVYSFFLLYFVAVLLSQLLHNGNKGRAELKDFLYSTIFFYALMYFLPYLIDYLIYVFDVLLYTITSSFSAASGGTGITGSIMEVWEQNYQDHPSLVFAFLYLATVCSGVFFFANYVGTALIQTVLFGAIPAVCLVGTRNKKLVSSWSGTFFPNLMIPLIDGILLMIPSMLSWVFEQNMGSGASITGSIAVAAIEFFAIWAIIPSRNAILHALGALTGVGAPKTGMMGLAALGMMAAKGLARGGKRIIGGNKSSGGTGEKEGFFDSLDKAKNSESTGEIYNEANRKLSQNTMEDINSIFGGGEGESAGSTGASVSSISSNGAENSSISLDGDEGSLHEQGSLGNSSGSWDSMPDIGMDAEFAEGLNEHDLGRYANLSARDAMSNELSENKALLEESGYDARSASAESMTLSNRNDEIDKELSSIADQREKMMSTPGSVDIAQSSALAQREQQLISEKDKNSTRLNEIQNNQRLESRNRELESGIKDCDRREASYASNNDAVGMNGKRFNSADEFKAQCQVNDAHRKMVNYKNFDSGDYDKLLTPDEKAKYMRERAIKEVVNPKKIAGTVAGVTAGTIGAAAMMYGGPQSMMTGAVGGYMAGSTASNAVASAPNTIRQTAEYAAPVVKKAAETVRSVPNHTTGKFTTPAPVRHDMKNPVNNSKPVNTSHSHPSTTTHPGYESFKKSVKEFDDSFNH